MADEMNTERAAIIRAAVAAMPHTNPMVADDLLGGFTMHTEADDIVAIYQAASAQGFRDGVASLSAAEPAVPALQPVAGIKHLQEAAQAAYELLSTHPCNIPDEKYCVVTGLAAALHHVPTLTQGAAIAAGADTLGVYCGIASDDVTDPTHPRYVAGFNAGHAAGRKRASHGQAPAQATPLEFTKEWCMAAAKAEEDSGADISAGVPFSPQAAQQAPATSEWDVRGHLAASLTFWHRLKDKEDDELVAALQSWGAPAATELNDLRRAFEPQTAEQEWTESHSLTYPSKAAQIINAARALLAAPAAPSTPSSTGATEGDEYVKLIAECRNAFPTPDQGDPLEVHWRAAMADPSNVPGYLQEIAKRHASPTIEGESK